MKLNRNEKYVKWGLTAFLVIVAAGLFWLVFSNLRGFYDLIVEFLNIIAALLYGCLFAYLMNPVMKVTQRIMDKLLAKRNLSDRMAARISKITGICVAVLVFCLAVYALIALIVPNLIASIEELLQPEKLESYYATISKWFRGIFTNSDIQSFLEKTVGDPLEMVIGWLKKLDYSVIVTSLTSSVYSVVMVIFNILLGIVAAVYILIFKEELCAQAKKVTVAVFSRQHADRLLELARRTNSIFGGYVMGKIIDAVLVGVITYFGVLFMGMPYAALIPMPTIAAILLYVAYGMSGWRNFAHLCRTASKGAVATLVLTFALTIVFDLVVAIGVGMLITVVLFMKMVSEETEVKGWKYYCDENSEVTHLRELPKSVRVYEINGPMFFGMTERIADISVKDFTRYLIIRMRGVPSLDATGMNALENLYDYCSANGVSLIFSHVNEQPMKTMRRAGFVDLVGEEHFRSCIDDAIAHARELLVAEEGAENLMKTRG